MNHRSQRGIDTTSGPPIPVMDDHPAVDTVTIRLTIRQTVTHKTVPTAERIDHLVDRLRGHVGLLATEDLVDDAGELKAMLVEAHMQLKVVYPGGMNRVERWRYAQCLATCAKGLLRCYEAAHPSS